jgi:hypothetical protein
MTDGGTELNQTGVTCDGALRCDAEEPNASQNMSFARLWPPLGSVDSYERRCEGITVTVASRDLPSRRYRFENK